MTVPPASFSGRFASSGSNRRVYMITQEQPCVGGAYGSSPFPIGPHTDGTRWSLVVLQYRIKLAPASLTRTRGRARSSFNLWLCSITRRSLSSAMDCFAVRAFIVKGVGGSGEKREVIRESVGQSVRCRDIDSDQEFKMSDKVHRTFKSCENSFVCSLSNAVQAMSSAQNKV